MRFGIVLVPEVGQASGPDLTRYLLVCAALIAGLLALAWGVQALRGGSPAGAGGQALTAGSRRAAPVG